MKLFIIISNCIPRQYIYIFVAPILHSVLFSPTETWSAQQLMPSSQPAVTEMLFACLHLHTFGFCRPREWDHTESVLSCLDYLP